MAERHYFLTVSGNRCGSTWLEFMLNLLPDVSLEYEMQWTAEYLSDLHVSMKHEGFDLQNMFDSISLSSRVVGSKVVFPPQVSVQNDEALQFNRLIGNQIAIVHIGRPFLDSYLSKLRNGGHLRNKTGGEPPEKSKRWLADAFEEKVLFPNRKLVLPLEEVETDFKRRLQNEQFNVSLNNGIRPYLYTEYHAIEQNFSNIVNLIGSRADSQQLSLILKTPPTQKLPSIDYSAFIENYEEMLKLAVKYEQKRQSLIN